MFVIGYKSIEIMLQIFGVDVARHMMNCRYMHLVVSNIQCYELTDFSNRPLFT